jgi:uncharacterized protein (DUF2147 family)
MVPALASLNSGTLMIQFHCLAATAIFALIVAVAPARAEELIGTWLTQQGDAHIRVARCGKALCGTVVWLKDPIDPKTRQLQADDKNPDPAKRSRKIVGIQIFAMEQDATNSWVGGIYNSEDGQTYRGRLSPRGHDELEVHGCSGNLCGSEVWTRAK